MKPEDVRMTAIRAICRERCAFMGEPACWQVDDDDGGPYPFPPDSCDEPGCAAIADAAIAAVAPMIAQAEREACAALANNIGIERWHGMPLEDDCDEVAAAIRARGGEE